MMSCGGNVSLSLRFFEEKFEEMCGTTFFCHHQKTKKKKTKKKKKKKKKKFLPRMIFDGISTEEN